MPDPPGCLGQSTYLYTPYWSFDNANRPRFWTS